jgi:tetratricopeptide (TPR) repeat protein
LHTLSMFHTFECQIIQFYYNSFYMHFTCRFTTPLLIVLLVLAALTQAFAQNSRIDSCSQLKFHSAIEQEGFNLLCSGQKPDYLTMAVAVNPNSDYTDLTMIRNVIKTEAGLLKAKMIEIKKPAARLKYVFDHVQSTYLKQYDLDAGFSEMFESGKHNCLTATILYALLLDELSIKHTIKFMPGHVYPIAYADDVPYIFETTDPAHGFVELNGTVQKNAIQSMRLMQFIASDNGKNKSTGDLFDRYYIKLNNTEMKGLVAYQYTNASFVAMLKQDFLTAYDLTAKGILLAPMDEMYIMQEELLKQAIVKANKTSSKRAELLAAYYNLTKNENKKNQIADEFAESARQMLFSSFPSPDSLLPVYTTLYNGIKDEDVRKVLEDTYTNLYLSYLRTQDKHDEAFDFIYKLYVGGNKSGYIKSQMQQSINILTDQIQNGNNLLSGYDTLASHYPALMDFEIFKYSRGHAILNGAGQAFRLKDANEGERLLGEFDKGGYFNPKTIYACNPAGVYSLAGSCYFKLGNHAKAKASLKKGLTFDPDNYEIKKKLSELK